MAVHRTAIIRLVLKGDYHLLLCNTLFAIIFLPLTHCLLPIDLLAVSDSLGVAQLLVAHFHLGMAQLHCFNSSIVENPYSPTTQALLQVGRAKSLALHIKIGDIEPEYSAQRVSNKFLLVTSARHSASEQLTYYIYLFLRKFIPSHVVSIVMVFKKPVISNF